MPPFWFFFIVISCLYNQQKWFAWKLFISNFSQGILFNFLRNYFLFFIHNLIKLKFNLMAIFMIPYLANHILTLQYLFLSLSWLVGSPIFNQWKIPSPSEFVASWGETNWCTCAPHLGSSFLQPSIKDERRENQFFTAFPGWV